MLHYSRKEEMLNQGDDPQTYNRELIMINLGVMFIKKNMKVNFRNKMRRNGGD